MTGLANSMHPLPGREFSLAPASSFTLAELTLAYNQARADYMIPMQMDEDHLAAYMKVYDVRQAHSFTAVAAGKLQGLAMLGVRPGRTWLTRLGVSPNWRKFGVGEALVQALLKETARLDRSEAVLEVIKGNQPALALFRKLGFCETRELLILRRPSGEVSGEAVGCVDWLEADQIHSHLHESRAQLAWTNEPETFTNGGDGHALNIDLGLDGRGWLVFRRQEALLSHFVFGTVSGNPDVTSQALLAHLVRRFPGMESYIENIPVDDPHVPALRRLGFIEVFRRIEMVWHG